VKNLHVPLPEKVYTELRAAAHRSRRPATALARRAIELWLRQNRRVARHQAIAAFAAECAGTPLDLDPDLEAAAVEYLVAPEATPFGGGRETPFELDSELLISMNLK